MSISEGQWGRVFLGGDTVFGDIGNDFAKGSSFSVKVYPPNVGIEISRRPEDATRFNQALMLAVASATARGTNDNATTYSSLGDSNNTKKDSIKSSIREQTGTDANTRETTGKIDKAKNTVCSAELTN